VIAANADQIQQLLTNLVTNAHESLVAGQGTIRLNIQTVASADIVTTHRFPINWLPQDPAYACLEVADGGCGIPGEDHQKLCDPFFSTKFTGRGMGLAVALGIVRAHGGAITVESQPGRGSVFRVYFPLSAEPVVRQPDQVTQVPRGAAGSMVLLVEDEKPVRDLAAMMLAQLGYVVIQARDGVEAVEIFRQRKEEIHCVLCDLTMPRLDGWGALTALRQLSPGIPVVLTSGYDHARVMSGEHPEWPQAFLAKPYVLEAMSNALGLALANRK
jgi:CheY-like chemotaxis protein